MSRLVPALVLALVVALAAPVAAQESTELIGVSSSVQATRDDESLARLYSSPQALVSPTDPRVVVAATADMSTRVCHLLRSNDAGQTWSILDALPSTDDYPFCFHTSGITSVTPIAWGSDATLYYALAGWGNEDTGEVTGDHSGTTGNISVLLSRSEDYGDTWDVNTVRDARGNEGAETETNRPISGLAVDTSGDRDVVYVGWSLRRPQAEPPANFAALAVSTDAGETFSEPIDLVEQYAATFDDPEGVSGGAPKLAVSDEGVLYALFLAEVPDEPQRLVLARSDDRGETFTYTEVPDPALEFSIAPVLAWGPGGGPQGTVHIAYEDNLDAPDGDRDVFYRRSTDGGETISDAVQLNDDVDPNGLFLQTTPQLSVAPDGRVDAAWWDFRNDPGIFANDVYYTYSTDAGATWAPNTRISDQSSSRRIGAWSNGYDMRGPVGIASADGFAVLAWDDTRLGSEEAPLQDVYTAVAQFEPVPGPGSATLRIALAVFVGLAVAGLALLAWSRRVSQTRSSRELAGVGR